jgi:hypothetical protein
MNIRMLSCLQENLNVDSLCEDSKTFLKSAIWVGGSLESLNEADLRFHVRNSIPTPMTATMAPIMPRQLVFSL